MLKQAVPDATDNEVDAIAIQHFHRLAEIMMDVNGLNDEVLRKD